MVITKKTTRDDVLQKLQRTITPKDLVLFSHLNPKREQYVPMFARQFEAFAENAKMEGARVIHMPYRADNFSDIFYRLPAYDKGAYGFYSGGVIDEDYYQKLSLAALDKGIVLINTADDNAKAMLFENYYPLIADLTAHSVVIKSTSDVLKTTELTYPLFIKGRIKSNKEKGWDACIVNDINELEQIAQKMFIKGDGQVNSNNFSELGIPQIIAREILPLRQLDKQKYQTDFPISREYRVFMHQDKMIDLGYYWADEDQFGSLSIAEYDDIQSLCQDTAKRLNIPISCIDVGQLTDGSWRVIEMGDPQHTGIANMPKGLFIKKLCAHLSK